MSATKRSKLTIVGVLVALAGIAAGVVLWFLASTRYEDAVGSLAPAPVGCDTTLEFDRAGTFFIYAETKGEVGSLDGDCTNDDQRYEGSDDNLDIVLFDRDDDEVDLTRNRDVSYDAGGATGTSLYSVDIEDPGEYTLRVQGDDTEVVARVGGDPNDDVALLRGAAIAALVVGVVLGVLFFAVGRTRGARRPDGGAYGWQGGFAQPGAPSAPPYQPAPGWGAPGTPSPPPPTPPTPPPRPTPTPPPPPSPPQRPSEWRPPSR